MVTTAPPKSIPRKALLIAALWLVAALILTIVLLRQNRPRLKKVDFDIVCERLLAPTNLTINLNSPPSQMRRAIFFGFEGSVANAAGITLDTGKQQPVPQGTFTLKRSTDPNETAPYLEETPTGGLGKMELDAGPGVVFSSTGTPGKEPYLTVKSAADRDLHFALQSTAAGVKGERYAIPEISPSRPLLDEFSMSIAGGSQGMGLDLLSGPPHDRFYDAKIIFNRSDRELTLFAADSEHPLSLAGKTLQLFGAINPDLRVEGRSATGVVSAHKVDLTMNADSGRLLTLGIIFDPEKKDSPALHLRGSLQARSLEQDGHELLPTLVEDILDKPYPDRSLWLVMLGLLAFVGFKVVDRALGVILKFFMPEE